MKHFMLALQFLTVLPVKISSDIKEADYGKSLLFFPLAGLIIGGLICAPLFVFAFLPAMVRAAGILILSVFITGALHLDGFADTCDGFYASRTQAEALRIMRDPHCGVMAVVGVVCLLLFEFALLTNLSVSILWKTLLLMYAFSRWAMAFACYGSVYPRSEGKAKFFIENAHFQDIACGGISVFLLFLLLGGLSGIMVFGLAFIFVILFKKYAQKKIGGLSGDTLGATGELAQASVLFFAFLIL